MDMKIISRQIGMDAEYKHWHMNEDNMIIYIHSGSGGIVCNERVYPIQEGTICFIGANKYHYTMPDDVARYERSKAFVSSVKLSRILSIITEKELFVHHFREQAFVYAQISKEHMPEAEALFNEMACYSNDEKYRDIVFVSCFLKLLTLMDQSILDASHCSHRSILKAIEYINSNIVNPIGIDSICEYVHLSKYHFCRNFKKATGMTVMQYILNTRIVLAKHMLEKGSLSIIEISELCGFSSISYFCRAFKEKTAMTPLQYKNLNNRKTENMH